MYKNNSKNKKEMIKDRHNAEPKIRNERKQIRDMPVKAMGYKQKTKKME